MTTNTDTAQDETIVIDRRFNGPANSGNGGYVAGVLAARIEGPAEVTLRLPPPLETPMQLVQDGDTLKLMDGGKLVAEGVPTAFDLNVPPAPSRETAEAAVANYSGFEKHTYPTCFVCGPERTAGDGLRIFAGRFNGPGTVAAPWTPGAELAVDGRIPTEIHWAALDCPGAFAVMERETPVVLGRMAAEIRRPVEPGARCVVMAWAMGVDGRKHFAGTALFNESGELAARALQTWIEVKP